MWFKKRKAKSTPKEIRFPQIYVVEGVVEKTEEYLKQKTPLGVCHEQVVYWAGKQNRDFAVVTTAIAPIAKTTAGSFETSARDNALVVQYLAKNNVEIIGQVHSHPGAFVDHSDGDDERAFMPFEGFLSLVVPRYGRQGMRPLIQCGVHRFENSRFRRLENNEVEQTFHIVPDFHKIAKFHGPLS